MTYFTKSRRPSTSILRYVLLSSLSLCVLSQQGEKVERLKAALQPVLAYHERDGKLPIYVLRSDLPSGEKAGK